MFRHGDRHTVHLVNVYNNTEQILKEYEDLKLGELPITYFMTLDLSVQPVVLSVHHIPLAMQDRVKELDCAKSLGVITPVSKPTDWNSFTHKKDRQEFRLCLNPKEKKSQQCLKETSSPNAQCRRSSVPDVGETVNVKCKINFSALSGAAVCNHFRFHHWRL